MHLHQNYKIPAYRHYQISLAVLPLVSSKNSGLVASTNYYYVLRATNRMGTSDVARILPLRQL
jgi:hypothetical protein